jgi:hypothetical protein
LVFLYQKGKGTPVLGLEDGVSILTSGKDRYFVYFRPVQECYVYLIQEDSTGNLDILFPKKGDGRVESKVDYWLPGFGPGLF